MRFDLKAACKNCPFRKDDTRVTFASRDRAEEIEEQAYRNGFPCHLSATLDDDAENGGYEFGRNTQHCAGALAMYLNEGDTSTPGTGNNERLFDRLRGKLDLGVAFDSVDDFLDANTKPGEVE